MNTISSRQSKGATVTRLIGVPALTFLALIVVAAIVRPSMFMGMMHMMASHM